MNKLRKGMIVVVETGATYGHFAGAITKIISKPGAHSDSNKNVRGVVTALSLKIDDTNVFCENRHGIHKFLNKSCYYEKVSDLRPATESEKKKYRNKATRHLSMPW